jgi:hypothetical protein
MENREIGVRFPTAADVFLFSNRSAKSLGAHLLSKGLKLLWCQAAESPAPSSKIKKAWSNSSTTTDFHGMVFNDAYRYI